MSDEYQEDIDVSEMDVENINNFNSSPTRIINDKKKKKKGNLNFNGVDHLNVYLPFEFNELIELIKYDFSLKELSININDYNICYYNENLESKKINEENYLDVLNYFDNIELNKRIIFIKPKNLKNEKFKDTNDNKSDNENENENENKNEKPLEFKQYVEDVVENEFQNFRNNFKALLLNGDIMDPNNKFKLNNNVHYESCIACGKEPITGFLYKNDISEEDEYICKDCIDLYDYPVFKIP